MARRYTRRLERSLINSALSAILVLALSFSAMEDGRVFVGRGPIFIFVTLVTCLKTRFESTRSECAFFCTNVFERDFVIEDMAWPGLVWPALARGRGCFHFFASSARDAEYNCASE